MHVQLCHFISQKSEVYKGYVISLILQSWLHHPPPSQCFVINSFSPLKTGWCPAFNRPALQLLPGQKILCYVILLNADLFRNIYQLAWHLDIEMSGSFFDNILSFLEIICGCRSIKHCNLNVLPLTQQTLSEVLVSQLLNTQV